MRIINVINDFLKIFFKFKSKKVQNYHQKVKSFEKTRSQIVEKKFILKILKKYRIKKLLDFGCNDCYLNYFLNKNIKYHGVDTNKELMKNKKKYSNQFRLIKKKIPFRNTYFDCVIMSHVFAHLAKPDFWISEVSKKLKNNGLLIIITPNKHYKFFYFFLNIFNNYMPDITISKHYSKDEIEKKLLFNKWTIIKSFSYSIKGNKIISSILNSRCIIIAQKINK